MTRPLPRGGADCGSGLSYLSRAHLSCVITCNIRVRMGRRNEADDDVFPLSTASFTERNKTHISRDDARKARTVERQYTYVYYAGRV